MSEPSELAKKGHIYANETLFEQRMAEILDLVRMGWDVARWELAKYVESPIERAMAECLITCQMVSGFEPPVIVPPGDRFSDTDRLQIAPQYRIDNYRADFALVQRIFGNQYVWIVVECDGHEFHERTKKQAAYDKSRDRHFIAKGWTVLRFTGSEIHADAGKCADQVGDLLLGEHSVAPRDHQP